MRGGHGIDSFAAVQEEVVGSCEHSDELVCVCFFFLHSWDRASLMYSFKYNQQDATLYNILYCCQCSTCFRWFLRPSSGAQNCTHSIWYMYNIASCWL